MEQLSIEEYRLLRHIAFKIDDTIEWWCQISRKDYDYLEFKPQIYRVALDMLIDKKMVTLVRHEPKSIVVELTEKGRAYLDTQKK